MFQKVHRNRVKLEGPHSSSKKMDEQNKLEIKMRKTQDKMRKPNERKNDFDEINKSKDSFKDKPSQYSGQLNSSKDSQQKDSVREEKEGTQELRQSNMSHLSRRRSDMSSHSRSVKDLSSLDYLRLKREQSRERGEYYDMGGGSYKNYKYEKLKLQRPEFSFLQSKPLDFFGKGMVFNRNRISNCNSTEEAIQSLKRQQDIINIGLTDMNQSAQLKESRVYQEIRQKIQNDIIQNQEKEYPFEGNQRITKGLAKLKQHIKEKNNMFLSPSIHSNPHTNSSATQNESHMLPSLSTANKAGYTLHNNSSSTPNESQSRMLSKSQSMSNVKVQEDRKWLSPMVKYEGIENIKYMSNQNKISKTDLILKNELLQKGQPDPQSQKLYQKLHNKKKKKNEFSTYNNTTQQNNYNEESSEGEGVCLNVINLNKGFKGKGNKMHSLLKYEDKHPNKNKLMGEVSKTFNKKTQYFLVVEEFNRLLNQDKIEKARQRTKKIKTKMDEKIDESGLSNKIATLDHCISQEIFLRETFFFDQYIRSEPNIRERLLYGISNLHNGIDFESYLQFYQIFVFKNTPPEVLIQFVCKYFMFNKKSILSAVKMAQFQESLREIVDHPQLLDKELCYQNWDKSLQEMKQISYDPDFLLRMKHFELIFKSFTINPNLILKLLFK